MGKYKAAFVDHLEREGIKYVNRDEDAVDITFTGKEASSIRVTVRFSDDDTGYVHFFNMTIGSFKDKFADALIMCNNMNKKYRWVKFYIDDDEDVIVDSDAIVDLGTVGPECLEIVIRTVRIVDSVYPDFMRIRWGVSS